MKDVRPQAFGHDERDAAILSDTWLASCLDELRSRLLARDDARVEEYLRSSNGASSEAVVDLIYGEYVLKRELGIQVSQQELCDRFPEYAEALRRQFAFDDTFGDAAPGMDVTTPAPQTSALSAISERIGPYIILELLGEGGQARAYRAIHPGLRSEVVVKVGKTHNSATCFPNEIAQEAKILSGVRHPNLVSVLDMGIDGGHPFMVTEYVRGQTLENLAKAKRFPAVQTAAIVAKIARALQAVHTVGVAHLDVTPANVVVDSQSEPRLIDFGLALFRDAYRPLPDITGLPFGTLRYMPPEQAAGDTQLLGPHSDIFTLGGLLFYLLTGEPPYASSSMVGGLKQAREGKWQEQLLQSADVPKALAKVCRTAMHKCPRNRYASAGAMADVLECYVSEARKSWYSRRKTILAGLATCGALGVWQMGLNRIAQPRSAKGRTFIDVWNPATKSFLPIENAWPIRSGDRVRFKATFAGFPNATLLLFSRSGWQTLGTATWSGDEQEPPAVIEYPSSRTGEVAVMGGPPGTEILLLLGHNTASLAIDEITRVATDEPLPSLDSRTLVHADGAQTWSSIIAAREQVKGIVGTERVPNASLAVQEKIQQWSSELPPKYAVLSAIGFLHGDQ